MDWHFTFQVAIAVVIVEILKKIFSLALELWSSIEDHDQLDIKGRLKRKPRRGFRWYRRGEDRLGAERREFRSLIQRGA